VLCILVEAVRSFRSAYYLRLKCDSKGNNYLRNIGLLIRDCTAQYTRKPSCKLAAVRTWNLSFSGVQSPRLLFDLHESFWSATVEWLRTTGKLTIVSLWVGIWSQAFRIQSRGGNQLTVTFGYQFGLEGDKGIRRTEVVVCRTRYTRCKTVTIKSSYSHVHRHWGNV
jgi:hypothetical protein